MYMNLIVKTGAVLSAIVLLSGCTSTPGPVVYDRPLTPRETQWAQMLEQDYRGWQPKTKTIAPMRFSTLPMPAYEPSTLPAPITESVQPKVLPPPKEPEFAETPSAATAGIDIEFVSETGTPGVLAHARTHVIEKGDTLSNISQDYYGTSKHWKKIFEANRDVIPAPEKLYIGKEIVIPAL